jgi:hypothetical protein
MPTALTAMIEVLKTSPYETYINLICDPALQKAPTEFNLLQQNHVIIG